MRSRAPLLAAGALLLLGLSGCPVTDDYFIEAARNPTGGERGDAGTSAGVQSSGGSAVEQGGGGNAAGGTGAVAGTMAIQAGGAPDNLQNGGAGGSEAECLPSTERCNGHDDNCDEVVDELACNSSMNGTTGCSGFVVASRPDHGYMLCSFNRRDFSHARDACAAQDMRLAWIESALENTEVSKKVDALTSDTEVLIGATDAITEDEWVWYEGAQFWQGDEDGYPVGDRFNAWVQGITPDNNNNEDCAVINPMNAVWGDRSCSATYAYLCEEPN